MPKKKQEPKRRLEFIQREYGKWHAWSELTTDADQIQWCITLSEDGRFVMSESSSELIGIRTLPKITEFKLAVKWCQFEEDKQVALAKQIEAAA